MASGIQLVVQHLGMATAVIPSVNEEFITCDEVLSSIPDGAKLILLNVFDQAKLVEVKSRYGHIYCVHRQRSREKFVDAINKLCAKRYH